MSERDLKRIEVLSEMLAGSHVSAGSFLRPQMIYLSGVTEAPETPENTGASL